MNSEHEKNNTYLGEDGLNHCSVCHEPVEIRFNNRMVLKDGVFPIPCACLRKKYEEEDSALE